jgi:hypothetical protein
MNEDAMGMLRAIYETLKVHQEMLAEIACVTTAFAKAMESDPKLYARYEKQYKALADGQVRRNSRKQIALLEDILHKLRVQ